MSAPAAVRRPATRAGVEVRRGPDWILIGAVAGLVALSVLLVWSATAHRDALTGGNPTAYLGRQLANVGIGCVLFGLVLLTDQRWLRLLTPVIYLASLLGLVLVLVMGSTVNGSQSWLRVGGMSVQPSEFAKIAVVIVMALVLAERAEIRAEGRWRSRVSTGEVLTMLALAGVPALLILAQPDLGTVLVLAATVFGVLAVSGAHRLWLLVVAGAAALAGLVAVLGGLLKDYQLDRFMAFTDPTLDPRGAGYNVEQARIAIGNGGLFGQGLFEGSQTRAGFVPEQQTDFIFTVAGEELGLFGAGLVVVLLGVVVWRALVIARRADDVFGRVAAAGIACWLGFQAFQNIGMCLGIMPVTGVPLPFVSYGGSSLFAGMLAVGMLTNIQRGARDDSRLF